jgi:ornithine cyclodeaminase/alanine dehydrogenase-like protein (mu-crystallin family)
MTNLPPLRYLTASDVTAAMPALDTRLELAALTLRGLAGNAELPPKIGVHPTPAGSFAHAMPAFMPGEPGDSGGEAGSSGAATAADGLGMKWVLGFPGNNALGLPAIHGILLLNDPETGVPTGILDAGPITAQRTAAISGVAIRAWAPSVDARPHRAALIGAGVQGGSHVAVLGHVLPGVELAIFDTDPDRATTLATVARTTAGIAAAGVAPSARDAVDGADVVISTASFLPPEQRQTMTPAWLGPDTLVVPVDYATYCSAEVARTASLFVVDHREQFLDNRDAGQFDGYPDPMAMMGEVLASDAGRPAGRVVATHLGTGLADVVFGTAILSAATEMGLGTVLPR